MVTNEYTFVIPVRPESINDVVLYGTRYSDVRALKKKWQDITMQFLKTNIDERELPEHFEGKAAFFFKLYFEVERRRDSDNYFLMCKGIIDAFVEVGILADDDHRKLDFDGIRIFHDRDRPRVEIEIKDNIQHDTGIDIGTYERPRK